MFSVEHLSQGDISFNLRSSEVLGLSGIIGVERTELARAIFDADVIDEGKIILQGKSLHIRSPRDAIRANMAYLIEDRKSKMGLCSTNQ